MTQQDVDAIIKQLEGGEILEAGDTPAKPDEVNSFPFLCIRTKDGRKIHLYFSRESLSYAEQCEAA